MESEKVKEIKKALEFQRDGLMYLENNCVDIVYCKDILTLINELERVNEELLKENEGYHGSYRCAIDKIGELSAERYIKVEQFAEKLKEKLEESNFINNGLWLVDTQVLINETLKEFIDKKL